MKTLEERLDAYAYVMEGHLLWGGTLHRQGYGTIKVDGKRGTLTHRVAWELAYGPIPKGICVLHLCPGEPHACIEPEHLYLGTYSDNTYDKIRAGNHPQAKKTHCLRGHVYDEDNTYLYRGGRSCRACR